MQTNSVKQRRSVVRFFLCSYLWCIPLAVLGQGLAACDLAGDDESLGEERTPLSTNFGGTFAGTVHSDNGTSTMAMLVTTQTNADVSGSLELATGLTVDAGVCGTQEVPAQVYAPLTASAQNEQTATGSFTQEVMGFTLVGTFTAELSSDRKGLEIALHLDVPWPCRDSDLSGEFLRQ